MHPLWVRFSLVRTKVCKDAQIIVGSRDERPRVKICKKNEAYRREEALA
jgi:hypothetical protein